MRAIAKDGGYCETTVNRYVKSWRKTVKWELKPCLCGKPALHSGACVKTLPNALNWRWDAQIETMIFSGLTVREIAQKLRLTTGAVLRRALPAREKLLEMGTRCPCGREIGHRQFCSATWDRFEMPRGPIPLEKSLDREIRKALLNGDRASDVAARTGIGVPTILRVRQGFTDDQLARRRRVMRQRRDMADEAYARKILRQIHRAVGGRAPDAKGEPHGESFGTTLEDIRNDIYLAVVEGRIEIEQIGAAVKRMCLREWWDHKLNKNVSLDADMTNDGRSLSETVSMDALPAKPRRFANAD